MIKVSVIILRALHVAINSMKYNPEIDQVDAELYQDLLISLKEDLSKLMED